MYTTITIPIFFFLSTSRPPRPTLFPYTTLFRSGHLDFRMTGCGREGGTRYARAVRCSASRILAKSRSSPRSEEHTSELQSQFHLVCRLLLEKKKENIQQHISASKPPAPAPSEAP